MSDIKAPIIRSNAFIDVLEQALGIDLGYCHEIVITANVDAPLDITIKLWGTRRYADVIAVLSVDTEALRSSVHIINETNT